ncbi:3'(2'),5'-bisphosphate nucleotidase CysQ [Aureimonas populi]|uniref:3'(2'),5'-bisphosphate nucleotidase CysQ n=1 Tax=Aureimonas populi TaxID=1701758 RepID=A0ABW5CK43_9HYPH
MIEALEAMAVEAGCIIMAVARAGPSVTLKADASPVTEADARAEASILAALRAAFPEIPVVAEEEVAAGLSPKRPGERFFLVDPLDGTREFIAGRPDFTVNIALVEQGVPVLGIVHAPARGTLYGGGREGAFAVDVDGRGRASGRRPIRARPAPEGLVAVASLSHPTPETHACLARFPLAECVEIGSSLKFCLLAEGKADLYPRLGPTMAWDTAAGDAVLRAAGGHTVTLDGRPLAYGAGAGGFANPFFIAHGPGVALPAF